MITIKTKRTANCIIVKDITGLQSKLRYTDKTIIYNDRRGAVIESRIATGITLFYVLMRNMTYTKQTFDERIEMIENISNKNVIVI